MTRCERVEAIVVVTVITAALACGAVTTPASDPSAPPGSGAAGGASGSSTSEVVARELSPRSALPIPLGSPTNDIPVGDGRPGRVEPGSSASTTTTTDPPPIEDNCAVVAPGAATSDGFDAAAYFVPARPFVDAGSDAKLVMEAPPRAPYVTATPVAGTDLVVVDQRSLSATGGPAAVVMGMLDRLSGTFIRRISLAGCNVRDARAIDDALVVVSHGPRGGRGFEVLRIDPSLGVVRWRWAGDDYTEHLSVLEDGRVFIATRADEPTRSDGLGGWVLTTLDPGSGAVMSSAPVEVRSGALALPSDAPELYVLESEPSKAPESPPTTVRRLDVDGRSSPAVLLPGFLHASVLSGPAVPGAAIVNGAIWYLRAPAIIEARRLDTFALQASLPLGTSQRYNLRFDVGPTALWVSGFTGSGSDAKLLQIDPITSTVRATHDYRPLYSGMRHPQPVLMPFTFGRSAAGYTQCDPPTSSMCIPALYVEVPAV